MKVEEIVPGIPPGMPKGVVRMMAVPWVVGQFVMTWAKHERMLADMISRITKRDYEKVRDSLLDGQIVDYEKAVKKLSAEMPADNPCQQFLRRILVEHVELRETRNDIVHGHWNGIGPDDEYLLKRKRRGSPDSQQTAALEDLYNSWRKLDRLGSAVIDAHRVFNGEQPYGTSAFGNPDHTSS